MGLLVGVLVALLITLTFYLMFEKKVNDVVENVEKILKEVEEIREQEKLEIEKARMELKQQQKDDEKDKIEGQLKGIFEELATERKIFTITKKIKDSDTAYVALYGSKTFSYSEKKVFIGFDDKVQMHKLAFDNIFKFQKKYPSVSYNKLYNALKEQQQDYDSIKEVIKLQLIETISQHTMDLLTDEEEEIEHHDFFSTKGSSYKRFPGKFPPSTQNSILATKLMRSNGRLLP